MRLTSSGRRTNGQSALPPGPSWRAVIEVVSRVRPEGWLVEPLPSGVWLRDPRVPILPIVKVPISAPETERPCVVLQGREASEPDAERALGAVLAALRVAGVASVRLVASRVPAEVAQRLAERADLELITADGVVRVEPAGLVVRAPAGDPLTMARWRAYRPDAPPAALGPVHPAPAWEQAVEFVASEEGFGQVHRVAAGLIVAPGGVFDPALLRVATELPVQADMPAIVAPSDDGNGDVIQSVDELLAALPEDLDAVRLYLDRAALGGPASVAGMLARRHHLDIVAPHASLDWRDASSNAVGSDRWLRVTPDDPFPTAAGRRARRAPAASPAEPWPRTGRAARSMGPEESTGPDEYLGSQESMGSDESMGSQERPPRSSQAVPAEERQLQDGPDGEDSPYESRADSAGESFADWYTAPAPPPDLGRVAPAAGRDRGVADQPPPGDDASLAESPVGQEQAQPPEEESAVGMETVERRGPICRVSRDHRSTDVERRMLRERLGSRFDLHLVVVNRLVANSPALRAGTAARPAAAIIANLVAVRAYLGGDLPELDDPDEPSDGSGKEALVACVASGLRHLPTHRGMVFRTMAGPGASASQWRVGQHIMEDWFTVAVLDGARLARPGAGGCRVAIWSETARRFASLFNEVGDAVFAAGTSFTVLDVDEGGGARPCWLYLREEPADAAGATGEAGQLSEVQLRTLTRLRAAVGQLPLVQETDGVPAAWGGTGSDPDRREAREVGPASPAPSGTGQPGVTRGPELDGWTATTGGAG